MSRRTLFLITLLPATLLLLPSFARAQERAEDVLPPYAGRFPQPAHEIEAPLARRNPQWPRQSLTKEERLLLAVPREDRDTYADFLRQKRTGLVRLLPRETFDGKLALRGGGAYYSFAHREHQYGYGSDIELSRGRFSVGFAGSDFGFLTDLGDTPLEFVSEDTDAVRFMAEFETPSAESEARAASLQFSRIRWQRGETVGGRQVDGRTYSRSLPAIVGHTYALRSVNYRYSDVLVTFRVLRQDENGSVLLLWKTLKTYQLPLLDSDKARR